MTNEAAMSPNQHTQRYREAQKVTWVSIVVNFVLTTAQILIGMLANAQSLVADGFHSLSDLVADLMVLAGNYHSRHPADASHPYGHQRIETAVSLALGLLLVGTGIAILWAAADRLQHLDSLPEIAPYALWAALATLAAKEGLFRYMLAVAERLRSPMLVANAWHARSDAASSLVVAAGLAGSLLGYRFLDPVAAIIVGLLILRMGAKFTYEAMQELVDTAPDDEEIQRIQATLQATPGVICLHELRTRRMAHQVLADAHVQVDARISVSEGHRIAEVARQRVLAAHPDVLDVLVHVDVEQDIPLSAGAAAAAPPARAELLAQLRQALADGDQPLPAFDKVLLHYLDGQVDVELCLPAAFCAETARVQRLQQQAADCLETLPWLRSLSLHCQAFSCQRTAQPDD
ncbi:MAG: cation diffusion facilitator family transporter [Sterolibacterium sp.]|nr:cation diffusion facilitator family transporter [Sterolibacterium sp.]